MKFILVISPNPTVCSTLRDSLASEFRIDSASTGEGGLKKFRRRRYDFTFIELELLQEGDPVKGHLHYSAALRPYREIFPAAELIILAAPDRVGDAVRAVKGGASNYLTYPIDSEGAKYLIESRYASQKMESELSYLRDSFWRADSRDVVRTESSLMADVFEKVRAVAPTKSTVLLTGETGTGKGVVARLIHSHSRRGEKQFISVHCGAIPDTLLESELFGHEKGAFTGAIRRKLGKFELAHEGTLLLDEVGTITPSAQIKLLQVLQEKRFQRVGGEAIIDTDVRIVAATNMELKKMTDQGLFRRDLYFRLSVFHVDIPPLRERKEDIPHIAWQILKKLNRYHLKNIHEIDPRVLEAFEKYSWPGNIRELENLMERAYILENSSALTPAGFPTEFFASGETPARFSLDTAVSLAEARRRGVETIERQYLRDLLGKHAGRIKSTAEAAGITPRQLHKLMKKYGIRKEEFK